MSEPETSLEEGTSGVETNEPSSHPRFGIIPSDWTVQEINEVAEVVGGSTPSTNNAEYWGGGIAWATPTDITELAGNTINETADTLTEEGLNSASTHLLPPYSVLMTSRATIGKCAVNTVEMATNQGFQNLVPKENVETWYLHYRMLETASFLESLGAGSTFDEVSKSVVESVEIPVPPLEEQRKIASVLYTVDQAIQQTEGIIGKVERIKAGLKQDILRQGLDPTVTQSVRIVSQQVAVSKEWEMVPLPEIAERGEKTFIDGDWVESDDMVEDGKYQLIQLGNLGEGEFKGTCDKYVDEEFFQSENCTLVEPGDLLIARMADPILRTIIVPKFEKKSITAVDIVVAKIDETEWDRRYIKYVLNTTTWQNIAEALASGSTRKRISRENMGRILIPKPPLDDQQEIADVIESIEVRRDQEIALRDQFNRLKKGLMQDILSGEVRTHDKDIEIVDEVLAHG